MPRWKSGPQISGSRRRADSRNFYIPSSVETIISNFFLNSVGVGLVPGWKSGPQISGVGGGGLSAGIFIFLAVLKLSFQKKNFNSVGVGLKGMPGWKSGPQISGVGGGGGLTAGIFIFTSWYFVIQYCTLRSSVYYTHQ